MDCDFNLGTSFSSRDWGWGGGEETLEIMYDIWRNSTLVGCLLFEHYMSFFQRECVQPPEGEKKIEII